MTTVNPTFRKQHPPTKTEVLAAHKRDIQKSINVCRVATIVAYDPGEVGVRLANVDVQIAQQQVTSIQPNGTQTLKPFPIIKKVPVCFPGGGGFTLTFPIAKGDECILIFHDRQLAEWATNGAGQPPTIGRTHDLSDAIALVGLRSSPNALANLSTTTTQLRNEAGTAYVEMAGGGIINIVAPGGLNITAPTTTFTGQTVTTGNAHIEGNLQVDGTAKGTAGVDMFTHHHGGVTTGGGTTGGPVT